MMAPAGWFILIGAAAFYFAIYTALVLIIFPPDEDRKWFFVVPAMFASISLPGLTFEIGMFAGFIGTFVGLLSAMTLAYFNIPIVRRWVDDFGDRHQDAFDAKVASITEAGSLRIHRILARLERAFFPARVAAREAEEARVAAQRDAEEAAEVERMRQQWLLEEEERRRVAELDAKLAAAEEEQRARQAALAKQNLSMGAQQQPKTTQQQKDREARRQAAEAEAARQAKEKQEAKARKEAQEAAERAAREQAAREAEEERLRKRAKDSGYLDF